jgi:hypothetical protein
MKNMPQAEIGAALGVSDYRVSQMLRKAREVLAVEGLPERLKRSAKGPGATKGKIVAPRGSKSAWRETVARLKREAS